MEVYRLEEKKAIEYLKHHIIPVYGKKGQIEYFLNDIVLNLIEKQSKEIEELKETLKCTQNSWYEDTQKIEEMKKQIDLDNECEIALNNRIMDLENADKKWEDKIKAKIQECREILYSFEKELELKANKDKFIHKESMNCLLGQISVLQSLLEKE